MVYQPYTLLPKPDSTIIIPECLFHVLYSVQAGVQSVSIDLVHIWTMEAYQGGIAKTSNVNLQILAVLYLIDFANCYQWTTFYLDKLYSTAVALAAYSYSSFSAREAKVKH